MIQTCVASDKETARQVEQIDSIKKNSALYHFYFFQLKLKKKRQKNGFQSLITFHKQEFVQRICAKKNQQETAPASRIK